jgi:hypothetical protein
MDKSPVRRPTVVVYANSRFALKFTFLETATARTQKEITARCHGLR